MVEYKKLVFEFSPEAVTRLDEIVMDLAKKNRAELVRDSIRFMEYAYKMVHEGYSLEFHKEGEEQVVISPLEKI
ncbi:MAG: hypothetical protein PVJ67_04730 [Candidatus Pacearchaeota archaeon]|jgi:hypothetical protein